MPTKSVITPFYSPKIPLAESQKLSDNYDWFYIASKIRKSTHFDFQKCYKNKPTNVNGPGPNFLRGSSFHFRRNIRRALFVFPTAVFVCSSLLPVFRKLSDKVGRRANILARERGRLGARGERFRRINFATRCDNTSQWGARF